MIYQLFIGGQISAWPDDAPTPRESLWANPFAPTSRLNVLTKKIEEISLDNTETRSITIGALPAAAPTEIVQIIARVKGWARLNFTAKDLDNATSISGKIPAKGTALFPGVIMLTHYNGLTYTLEGLEDSTVVELFAAICVDDDDARWTTYA